MIKIPPEIHSVGRSPQNVNEKFISQSKKEMECLKINLFIYLFLAALALHCCAWAFSSCGEQGLLFIVVHRLLIAVASLVVEHGF